MPLKSKQSSTGTSKPQVRISSTGGVSVSATDILASEKAMRLIRAAKRVYPKPSNSAGRCTDSSSN